MVDLLGLWSWTMVMNVYAKFPYGLLRIKKALGISWKGNNNPNNRPSDLGPFPGPKIRNKVAFTQPGFKNLHKSLKKQIMT